MVQLEPASGHDADQARELPMAGRRRERADASANRRRILEAARRLVAEHGSSALTMQAVASAAGVGKATVFHRFGDRDGLTQALIDEYMREFQDAFLHGPPPLGPGAEPAERLEAFVLGLVRLQIDHLELALAAEPPAGHAPPPAYGTLLLHISTLVHEIDPELDERVLAGFILSAIAPAVLDRMRSVLGTDTPALQASARALLQGITHQP